MHPLASLEGLPDDVLAHVFELLGSSDLARLRELSRHMDARVLALGFPLYATHNPVGRRSAKRTRRKADTRNTFYTTTRLARAIARHDVCAAQVGAAWAPTIPVLSLSANSDALIVGAGGTVRVHPLSSCGKFARAAGEATTIKLHPEPSAGRNGIPRGRTDADIVGLYALPGPSGRAGADLVIAQLDGSVRRFVDGQPVASYPHPRGVQLLTGYGDMLLSIRGAGGAARIGAWRAGTPVSQDGAATPTPPPTPTPPTPSGPTAYFFSATTASPLHTISLPSRAWSAHLCARGAFLGLRGAIYWHEATPSGLDHPTRLLPDSDEASRSAAYGLVAASATTGPLGGTLLSAWHDGTARIHDLRHKNTPVMHLSDPWSDAALFSAAFVGPHGVVAGGAEHGVVHVWDVRFAGRTLASPADELDADAAGWSVFSPHGRGSPVYALAGDGARVWGATERRAFVLAFDDGELGPAVGGHQGDAGGAQRGRRGSPVKHDRGWNTNCAAEARQKVMGYRHGEGGMTLFESRTHGLALPDIGSLSLYA